MQHPATPGARLPGRTALLAFGALALAALAAAGAAQATLGDFFPAGHTVWSGSYPGHNGGPSGYGAFGEPIDLNHSPEPDCGDAIRAPEAGSVTRLPGGTWAGNHILWTSANGRERIHLAHLASVVKTGTVAGGDIIATLGDTGNSSGCHIHASRQYNGAAADMVLSGYNLNDRANFANSGVYDWSYTSRGPIAGSTDTADPETTPSLTGTAGTNGWWKSDVAVRLTATDTGGSGVASIKYRVNSGTWRTYTGPVGLANDGTFLVEYYAVDNAGNQEAPESITVRIDTVAPGTTHAFAGTAGLNGWFRSPVAVSLAATDATSGVASTTGTRDGAAFTYAGPFTVAGEGSHALTYRSQDRAGNVEAVRSASLKIDTVAPVTAMAFTGPSYQGAQWFVSEATAFTLAATDATSGVRATTATWRGAALPPGPFRLPGADGPGTLAWRSDDQAGNAEALRSAALVLDTTPPVLALTTGPAEGAVLASLEPVPVTAEASDAGSGVARVEFVVDGVVRFADAAAPYAWAWAVGEEALGDHVLEVRAVDRLGHAAVVRREVSTVPSSAAGAQATALRAQGVATLTAADLTALVQGGPPTPEAVPAAVGRAVDRAMVFVPAVPAVAVPPEPPALPLPVAGAPEVAARAA